MTWWQWAIVIALGGLIVFCIGFIVLPVLFDKRDQ
jgi:hypothetical protein